MIYHLYIYHSFHQAALQTNPYVNFPQLLLQDNLKEVHPVLHIPYHIPGIFLQMMQPYHHST